MIDGTTLSITRRTAMTPQDILLHVFCLVDDEMKALDLPRLRRRGPHPTLSDSEVITIELVGEFWGLGKDRDLVRHFRRYHAAEFPALARVHRTTFARQAANLWRAQAADPGAARGQAHRRHPALAGRQPADRGLPVRPRHLLPPVRRRGRLWI